MGQTHQEQTSVGQRIVDTNSGHKWNCFIDDLVTQPICFATVSIYSRGMNFFVQNKFPHAKLQTPKSYVRNQPKFCSKILEHLFNFAFPIDVRLNSFPGFHVYMLTYGSFSLDKMHTT